MRLKLPEKTISSFSLAVIGAAAVLLIAGATYYVQQERQRRAIEAQTSTTNKLIEEVKSLTLEVRGLSQRNKELNEQNRDYAYCNAVLLAKYTQTQEPIVIEDLDKCVLQSFPRGDDEERGTQQQPVSDQQSSPQQTAPSPQRTQNRSPQNPSTPANPGNQQPQNNILTIPDLLELNTPCVSLGGIETCR